MPSSFWTLLTTNVGNTSYVDKLARLTLAENLKKVIAASGLNRTAWANSRKLDVKAVERAVKGLNAPRLDFVEELARACQLEPWQLLHPKGAEGVDPAVSTTPVLSDDVLDLARQINEIVNNDPDELRRKWAFRMMSLAVAEPARTAEKTLELVLTLTRELQPN